MSHEYQIISTIQCEVQLGDKAPNQIDDAFVQELRYQPQIMLKLLLNFAKITGILAAAVSRLTA